MKSRCFVFSFALIAGWPTLRAAESLDKALDAANTDYKQRVETAAAELNRTRERIAAEKVPLVEQIRAAENRILLADGESTRVDTRREDTAEQRRKLLLDLDSIRKSTSYVATLARDGLKSAADGLAPGEEQLVGENFRQLEERIDGSPDTRIAATLDAVDFLIAQTEREVGGYRAAATVALSETQQVVKGTLAFVGPETYFRAEQGGAVGTVRVREGTKFPVAYVLPLWKDNDASRFFAGQPSTIFADASSGKALKLKETTGSVWDHVRKGGIVAFIILGVGLLAIVMIFQKIRDLTRMGVDAPEKVQPILDLVARGARQEAETATKKLGKGVRDLFLVGLRHADQPKELLEERLEAVLLEQRMIYERRLPLLAVVATASPLMGLLGTVVGMVKTFALITVFGTGSAAKLSSGISEVLVSTELGLIVAIPTLVAHGFLAHRIHKNLAQLERYALKFCTSVETAKVDRKKESVPV